MFSSGYTANLGAVVALSGPGSLMVSDALHPRLPGRRLPAVAGARRGDAAPRRRRRRGRAADRAEERAVVVTDSVFSADGVLAPLRALHDVCRATARC